MTAAVPPDHRVVSVAARGGRLEVSCRYRPGVGEALVYFHGLGSTSGDFLGAWNVPEWSNHALLAFDAPACGATRGYRAGLPLGVDDIVRVAEALVAELRLDGLTVIGHSLGGLAGLLFASRHQASVRRFVNVEGNLGPEDCALYSRRVFQERFLGREGAFMTALAEELRASTEPGLPEVASSLRRNVEDAAFFDYCRSIVAYSDGYPLMDTFVALRMPRIYVHGAEPAPPYVADLIGRGVSCAAVPASGHFPVASNPARYYAALVDFMHETAS